MSYVRTHIHTGHQSTAFNSMANVYVGGKVSRNGRSRIERPFAGVISGLSINGLRILDLTSDRDPHTTIRGDVQLVTGVLDRNDLQRMQQVRFKTKFHKNSSQKLFPQKKYFFNPI